MKKEISGNIESFYFHRAESRAGSESGHHYHAAYEIYYLKMGEVNYFIGDRTYAVTKGDIVFIPEGIIHRTNYSQKPHTRLLINFSGEYVPTFAKDRLMSIPYLYRDRNIADAVERIFDEIEKEYSEPDQYSAEALRCYVAELVLLLLRNNGEGESALDEDSGLAERAAKYILENYSHDVKLSEVADILSVSSEHLSRLFKKSTGFGFNEYLTLKRLSMAEYMLKNEPGRSIGEIAYECGFNDGNYFSYRFKAAYGKSPREIRRSMKKGS